VVLAPVAVPIFEAAGAALSAAWAWAVANVGTIAVGTVVVGGGAVAVKKVLDQSNTETKDVAISTTCQACEEEDRNPCAKYACGVPGSKYRGGAHGCTKLPVRDNLDSHHTPARAASYLSDDEGPAIQMDPADHARTASNSRSGPGYMNYIATQTALVDSGNFMSAVAMDVADIESKFPGKYEAAIAQMLLYANCLKQYGLVR
jgi:hypothetical protein